MDSTGENMDNDDWLLKNQEVRNAFFTKDYKKLDEIISNGFDVNSKIYLGSINKKTMLAIATISNDTEMVDFLISKGADIKQDAFAFSVAAYHGHIKLLKKYLDLGADINGTEKDNPLEKATDQNKLEVVKFLIKHGADVNKQLIDYNDKVMVNRPLENATSNDNLEMIDCLVENGAKITQEILFYAALCEGEAFNHYISKYNVKVSDKTEKKIRDFCLTNAIETINKVKLKNKLEKKLKIKESNILFDMSNKSKQVIDNDKKIKSHRIKL
jgi:hypothetical protein